MIEGIPDLEKYRVVLVTRDPRDILVSGYYSIAYSHSIPNKEGDKHDNFILSRAKARESTIDDYVISESDKVYDIFSRYQTLLIDKYENIYLTTYEQMVLDFQAWLTDLFNYCEFDLSGEFIQTLLRENEDKKPKKENIHQHIRKGQPGDYKQKLKPETTGYLDEKFGALLKKYHYNQT
ncbi:MAG: sulfotransferase domain-containing protein [Candidatus Omnitrophica bacterium]|nr:sulfotransferase domain-containing protein [Candidatus Omnitrophota bacterium]